MMNNISHWILFFAVILGQGCRKKFDQPPLREDQPGVQISIADLKARLTGTLSAFHFTGDSCILCTVTADESSGNFYRQVFVRDDEGNALQIGLKDGGSLFTGDRLRMRLDNSWLILANGEITLDSMDIERNVVKLSAGNQVTPRVLTIQQVLLAAYDPTSAANMQSQLVEINGLEFSPFDRGKPMADAIGKTRKEYLLADCKGNSIFLSTSGFADFAAQPLPSGNGKVVAVVTQYGTEMQLMLRRYSDLSLGSPTCGASTPTSPSTATFALGSPVSSLNESFDDAANNFDYSKNGWINFNETGKVKWKGNVKQAVARSIKASAFGTGETNTMWMISPPVIFTKSMKLSFKTGAEFWKTGHPQPIMAYVSTDFTGKNFNSANWTAVTTASYVTAADGSYNGTTGLRSSGQVDLGMLPLLKDYSGTFFIAFRYSGSPAYDSNIYLDDLVVQ